MKTGVLLFTLIISQLALAEPPIDLEASSCVNCTPVQVKGQGAPEIPQAKALEEIRKNLADDSKCKGKSLLFDPNRKSVLQEFGFQDSDSSPYMKIARGALTCIYGALNGGVNSVSDLVMAIPHLIGLSWRGLKAGVAAAGEFDWNAWLSKMTEQNIKDSAGKAFEITSDKVRSSYAGAKDTVLKGYEMGGAGGAVAAVAVASMRLSPHAVVGKFMLETARKIAESVATEWDGFACLPGEVMSEVVCKVAGYITVDILTGKIILSAIRNADKFREALGAVRSSLERKPIVGQWLLRDLKTVEPSRCDKIAETEWKIDSKLRLQNQSVDVARSGGALLARGVDPTTGKPGCFEMAGRLALGVTARLLATEARATTATGLGAADIFSPQNIAYARTNSDFVRDVNAQVRVGLSQSQSEKIAAALGSDPQALEQYGGLMRAFGEMRDFKVGEGLAKETAKHAQSVQFTEQMIKTLNTSISKVGHPYRLNIDLVTKAVHEATASGSIEPVLLLNRVLHNFNKVAESKPAEIEKSIAAWEKSYLAKPNSLSQKDLARARECLFIQRASAN